MSQQIKVGLDQVWSITDEGFLRVEATAPGNPNHVLGQFTFDEDTILEDLKQDIEDHEDGHHVDFLDWVNLSNALRYLADHIDLLLEEVE